ncbi:MAG: hypothetical protein BWY32_01870 [bacterium ADurb.Bin243]|nr:MAG: hypothetical protein BWY32_01870 [bacterium ADurb.Bin243]
MDMDTRVTDLLKLLEERLAKIDRDELMKLFAARIKYHHSYSFNNMFLAGIQLCRQHGRLFDLDIFSTLWLAPFTIWNKWGYHVKRGAKALNILVPFMAKKKAAQQSKNAEENEWHEKKVVGFGIRAVFDVSQTEKLSANEDALHRRTTISAAHTGFEELIRQVEAAGLRVLSAPLRECEGGHISGNVITLNINNTVEARYCTLLHETAHYCLGHLNAGNFNERSVEELEAESCAFVIGANLGIDIPSQFYIASWNGDGKTIRKSLARIDAAVKKMMAIFEISNEAEVKICPNQTACAALPAEAVS